MTRSTIIFGNGLGMALSADYFALSTALRKVWSGSEDFHDVHKQLVSSAIPGLSDNDYPRTEEQLDQLQVAIVASEFLRRFERPQVKWLADEAKELPEAFRRFLHEVAAYFHASGLILPLGFQISLAKYIHETKSHVATLNYDNLLYDAFRGQSVLDGYHGPLIDGFHRSGFSVNNLVRFNPSRHGWYLRLHGSPLFVGNQKLMGEARKRFEADESSHIVLTHVKHKPLVIEGSGVLSVYWDRFHEALSESTRIIILGYSGEDVHLNQAIGDRAHGRPVCIIEWSGSGSQDERELYWERVLKLRPTKVVRLENVLSFTSWRDA